MDRNPNETARKTAAEALSRLAADLDAGRGNPFADYLVALSRHRGHPWQNVLLIRAQRPDATQVAGIHAWNDLGRVVKKGEKGILIFATVATKDQLTRLQAPPESSPFPLPGFRAATVFDVSQTEGQPVAGFSQATVDPETYMEQLRALAAKRGIELKYDGSIASAQGTAAGGEIRMMPRLSTAEEISALAHERLLHRQEAATLLTHDLRETQADAIAFVVSCGLGLKPPTAADHSFARYDNDLKALAQSLAVIQETSAQILDELLPENRTPARPLTASHERASLRDAQGFGKIHDQYRDRLFQSIKVFVRDRENAEDITARAFEVGWENREQFRGDAEPYTWLLAIARNEARQSWRGAQRMQFDSIDQADIDHLAAAELVTDELEKRDDRFRLQKALECVPPMYRRALNAHVVEGLSMRDIACREGVPLGTVLSRIYKGKQLLRDAWAKHLTGLRAGGTPHGAPSHNSEERQGSPASNPSRDHRPEPREPVCWDR